jgi:hypothetical protein
MLAIQGSKMNNFFMPTYYSVEITKHDDPDTEASFLIRPPIYFLSPEAKEELVGTLRGLIKNRMGENEDNDLRLAITHNLADGSATVGRAHFRGLQLATGAVVLQQALELGLNGTNAFVSPTSPIRS